MKEVTIRSIFYFLNKIDKKNTITVFVSNHLRHFLAGFFFLRDKEVIEIEKTYQDIPRSCKSYFYKHHRCKKSCKFLIYRIFYSFEVELAGIEPASKRGSNMLSTCLSPDLIFE